MTDRVYERLAARFDVHHKDPRGPEYLTGNQVVGRLNDVLGPANWTFTVREHGYDEESDEIWVLGSFTATIDGTVTMREQFGSQKHNRRRHDKGVIDYGFDLKGAATDALKKCATLVGVGLYLSEKEGGVEPKPSVEQPRQPKPPAAPSEPMVTHPSDRLYQRYMTLVEEAQRLEMDYDAPNLPMSVAALRAAGVDLKRRLDAMKVSA